MGKIKAVTHWFAVAFVAVAGFAMSPAGKALVAQYPKLSVVAVGIATLAALYHVPNEQ